MGLFIFLIIISFLSIIYNIIRSFKKINILNKNGLKKLYSSNYDSLKIIRKRGKGRAPIIQDIPLTLECTSNWSSFPLFLKDYIEVYGIKGNKEVLIINIDWSKSNVNKIIEIVNDYNKANGA